MAAALDPLNAATENNLGLHELYAGRLDEAEKAFRKALELDPNYPSSHMFLGRVLLRRSQPAKALKEMEREQDPFWHLYGRVLALHALGRDGQADKAMSQLIAEDANDGAFQIAEACAYRGEVDEAFEWLNRAYAQRDGGLGQLVGDPLFAGLQHDPRWAAFLLKTGLAGGSPGAPTAAPE